MSEINFKESVEKAFKIIDNEEMMRVKVFEKKGNPKLLDQKVAEMKFLRKFLRSILKSISRVSDSKHEKIYVGMRDEHWQILISMIKENVRVENETFWSVMDFIEGQLEVKKSFKNNRNNS